MHKLCSKCQTSKPFPESFFRDSTTKSGYHPTCKKCDVAIKRKPFFKSPEYRKKYRLRYRIEENRKKIARAKLLYARSSEFRAKRAASNKRYRQSLLGRATAFRAKMKRRHLGARIRIKLSDMAAIRSAFKNACAYCGIDEHLTFDHFLSLNSGGETVMGNLVLACHSCNSSKQHRPPETWCAPNVYVTVRDILETLKQPIAD
jgi:5-methylcytosine-specific restriction endonuclease McrA